MDQENIYLAVAVDKHYMILLAALLKSIEVNHTTKEHIHVYIVENGVTAKYKAKLRDSISEQAVTLHWLTMGDAVPRGMALPTDTNTYPPNIYMRLFIPYFVPEEVERVLYLDVDMVLMTDISKLWSIDIEGSIIGAVTCPTARVFKNIVGNYKELGIPAETKYFNSGLLLMDIPKWRRSNITEKVIECIDSNRKYADFSDQYGLNVVLFDKWHEIDPMWNYYSSGDHSAPYLIHFAHRKPFYKSYFGNTKYKRIFYTYLNQTRWRNSESVGELRRYMKKIGNILQKNPLLRPIKLWF
ncbi:glycosyltransferase family 8 protein [Pontibacter harenae]|uniref:glycosyltransferase family 8 protein n=1 Tax=Pontibacter harenae TaxID=2894083 RepID=UPI001E3864CC|nr:glycosyltransferase family 8 protein [Pontibacter harenae]MCC9169088.1 glycosyltransferase family 8 protein [Pontibacter harenae]